VALIQKDKLFLAKTNPLMLNAIISICYAEKRADFREIWMEHSGKPVSIPDLSPNEPIEVKPF